MPQKGELLHVWKIHGVEFATVNHSHFISRNRNAVRDLKNCSVKQISKVATATTPIWGSPAAKLEW